MGTEEINFESNPIPNTDNLGNEKFWENALKTENDGLALKIFKEEVCNNFTCHANIGPWND